jgi:broad specificity phosphatase PhoE
MRTIELRRHTMRAKPGPHLTQAGVTLARRVGATAGPFDRVVTSTVSRAFETALAMGFAVDEQLDALAQMGDAVDTELQWPAPFGEISQALQRGGAAGQFGGRLARLLRAIARTLPEGGAALVISHGGIVEAAAIASLPEADHAAWGAHCDYCEGVRLRYEGDRCVAAEVLRV